MFTLKMMKLEYSKDDTIPVYKMALEKVCVLLYIKKIMVLTYSHSLTYYIINKSLHLIVIPKKRGAEVGGQCL